MSGVALLVIAKAPVPGRVKTRLCPPCTPEQAAGLACAALTDTLHCLAAVPAPRRVLVLDGAPGPWLPCGFDVVPQTSGGLAERLAGAFAAVDGPAFLVGMDTPQLQPRHLAAAVSSLETPGIDSVLGPAYDGGWWGVGLRSPTPAAFLGVPMSTPQTGARQLERLTALGLRTRTLPRMRDIDTFPDALAAAAAARASRFAAAVSELGAAQGRRAA
jgi:rSAM/selenodomain-associated transferase 1